MYISKTLQVSLCIGMVAISGVTAQAQEVTPAEIENGIKLEPYGPGTGGLVMSANGRWLIFKTNEGFGYMDLSTRKLFAGESANWYVASYDGSSAWSPKGDEIAFWGHRE